MTRKEFQNWLKSIGLTVTITGSPYNYGVSLEKDGTPFLGYSTNCKSITEWTEIKKFIRFDLRTFRRVFGKDLAAEAAANYENIQPVKVLEPELTGLEYLEALNTKLEGRRSSLEAFNTTLRFKGDKWVAKTTSTFWRYWNDYKDEMKRRGWTCYKGDFDWYIIRKVIE